MTLTQPSTSPFNACTSEPTDPPPPAYVGPTFSPSVPGPGSEPAAEPETEPEAEPETEPKTEPETAPEAEPETEPESEPVPDDSDDSAEAEPAETGSPVDTETLEPHTEPPGTEAPETPAPETEAPEMPPAEVCLVYRFSCWLHERMGGSGRVGGAPCVSWH